MPDPAVSKAQQWLRSHETDLLEDYRAMMRINTIESEPQPNAPFGSGNREALDLALALGERWGMRTKDLDGFIGYAEFGSGPKLVTILGHLDVVPVGPGWKHEPFGAEIDNGYVYGRGAVDDKGPTMASFYAARAILETAGDIGARIRVVFGCDEESGFECIHHYAKVEEHPTYGIAPDAGWPLYYAEKGIAIIKVGTPLIEGSMALVSLTGGQRPNIVIDAANATVRVASDAKPEVEAHLADSWDRNISYRWSDSATLEIEAIGKAAHGSWPWGGDNAAIRIMRFLMEIAPLSVKPAYAELFEACQISGAGLDIDGRDDVAGELTNNLGIVETVDSQLHLTFNPRYPVTWKGEDLLRRLKAKLSSFERPYEVVSSHDGPPLYFPIDHPLVAAVCAAYKEETGEDKKPGTMGGGTYARAISNTVAVGTGWEGDGEAHQTDERLKIDHLHKMSRIYANIIHRLATI